MLKFFELYIFDFTQENKNGNGNGIKTSLKNQKM